MFLKPLAKGMDCFIHIGGIAILATNNEYVYLDIFGEWKITLEGGTCCEP